MTRALLPARATGPLGFRLLSACSEESGSAVRFRFQGTCGTLVLLKRSVIHSMRPFPSGRQSVFFSFSLRNASGAATLVMCRQSRTFRASKFSSVSAVAHVTLSYTCSMSPLQQRRPPSHACLPTLPTLRACLHTTMHGSDAEQTWAPRSDQSYLPIDRSHRHGSRFSVRHAAASSCPSCILVVCTPRH